MNNMAETLQPIYDILTASLTPLQMVTILSGIIGVGMGFVLMWFGVRKLISIFKSSALYGRLYGYSIKRWQHKQYKYSVKHYGFKGSYHDMFKD